LIRQNPHPNCQFFARRRIAKGSFSTIGWHHNDTYNGNNSKLSLPPSSAQPPAEKLSVCLKTRILAGHVLWDRVNCDRDHTIVVAPRSKRDHFRSFFMLRKIDLDVAATRDRKGALGPDDRGNLIGHNASRVIKDVIMRDVGAG
jgi:hypothetical protein